MTLKSLVNIILGLINQLVVALLVLVLAVFIVKIIINMQKSGEAEGRKGLSKSMIYGLLGVFFALSFFAIARLFASYLGI